RRRHTRSKRDWSADVCSSDLGSYAVEAIEAYLVRGRPEHAAAGKGSPALFLNRLGSRISRQTGWNVLKQAAVDAQITTEISPHTDRKSVVQGSSGAAGQRSHT